MNGTRETAVREARRRAKALGRAYNVFVKASTYTDYIIRSTREPWPKGWLWVCTVTSSNLVEA